MEPKKIKLSFKAKKPVLGLGSHTKNTVCFIKGNFAYLSPAHPDLTNPKDFLDFEKDVKYFLKKAPEVIAYDLHPEYMSSKYAQELPGSRKVTKLTIQHHHAHIVSCMVENGLKDQKVIGVAFDGTGLGRENKIWGAEFLICDYKGFKRRAHLKEIPLLGGQKAISEPGRVALAWLYQIYKDRFFNLGINFVKGIDKKKWQVLRKMYLSGFNAPLASSMGRLFDAAAAMVLAKYRAGFEAQLAIELEKIARAASPEAVSYGFKIIHNKEGYVIDPGPIFKGIIKDIKAGKQKARIAHSFHLSVAQIIRKACLILRKETRLDKVVLSGGVFQNSLLLNLALGLLYREGFKVYTHKELSCNDSGISLGQAVIASLGD